MQHNTKYQRRYLATLLLVIGLLGLVLTACGDSPTTVPSTTAAVTSTTVSGVATTASNAATTSASNLATTAAATGPKTKVVWWTPARHDLTFMNEQVALYNKSNTDNIELEYKVYTDDYAQVLDLAWQAKQGPDIVNTRVLNLPKITKAKLLEPLDGYLTPEVKRLMGAENMTDGATMFDGKLYALPNTGWAYRIIYNKDLFKKAGLTEPPKTVSQMVEYAKKLTEAGKAENAYGFAINLKSPALAWSRSLIPIANRSGFNAYDFKTGQYNFATYKPVLQAFRQIVQDGSMIPSYQTLDIDPLRAQFAEGKIGMYLSHSAEPGVYTNQFKAKIDWAAAPVPTLEETPKGVSAIDRIDWQGISAQSKNKDAAWKVLQWFYRQELLTNYHEQGFGVSVLPEVLKTAKESTMKGVSYFLPNKTDANWPVAPVLSKIEGKNADAVYTDYVLGVATELDKNLSDLSARYNKALEAGVAAGDTKKVVIPDFDPLKLQKP
jgi:multiple sugar transport system substrate-binding protein